MVKYYYGRTLLAMKREGGYYFYHLDLVGSVIAVTDGNGTVYNRYRYTAFGSLREKEEVVPNRLYFNGKPMDDTGLYYYGFRYYAPGLGRFVRPDLEIPGLPVEYNSPQDAVFHERFTFEVEDSVFASVYP